MSFFLRPLLVSGAVLASAATYAASQGVTPNSPFMPSDAPIGPAAGPDIGYDLVGIIASSKETLVGLTNKTTRKSSWIPVGRSADGIEVVSCDAGQDRAVIRVNGQLQSLVLRSASVSTQPIAPTAVSAPPTVISGSANPTTKAQQAEQEKEARMLVSDLMEIGIQQRKAYEAARREEAQKNGAKTPQTKAP